MRLKCPSAFSITLLDISNCLIQWGNGIGNITFPLIYTIEVTVTGIGIEGGVGFNKVLNTSLYGCKLQAWDARWNEVNERMSYIAIGY